MTNTPSKYCHNDLCSDGGKRSDKDVRDVTCAAK